MKISEMGTEITELFFRDGYVKLEGLLSPDEIELLRADSSAIIFGGYKQKENQSDYMYSVLPGSGEEVFHRVQYVFPKAPQNSFLKLLGHPSILALVQRLLGPDFLCAAEALVFKMAGNGREVPVHADCDPADPRLSPLIFNVDYYLDDSSEENGCLYVAPGTHKQNLSAAKIHAIGFNFPGLKAVPAKAGDVLLHNIRLVHGSHGSRGGALRRTLYFEFQSLTELLKQDGPRPGFTPTRSFITDRIRLLMHAIDSRRQAPYAQDETPFSYQPPAWWDVSFPTPGEPINLRPALGYNAYI